MYSGELRSIASGELRSFVSGELRSIASEQLCNNSDAFDSTHSTLLVF